MMLIVYSVLYGCDLFAQLCACVSWLRSFLAWPSFSQHAQHGNISLLATKPVSQAAAFY